MTEISQILKTITTSPSVGLLRLRNREIIIGFLVQTFLNKQGAISSENIHTQLSDFLEGHKIEIDEESEISVFDTSRQTKIQDFCFHSFRQEKHFHFSQKADFFEGNFFMV